MTYVREKRSIASGFVMSGDDEAMDVSLDAVWEFLSSDSNEPPTPKEVINHTGNAASWVTSGSDPCEPWAFDIELINSPPCTGIKGERIVLEEFRVESVSHDLKAATLALKGKCKALRPTTTRETVPIAP